MNSFNDLRFVIPPNAKVPSDIPKTFIYADSVEAGTHIEDYLNSISPGGIADSGCIRPYSAAFTAEQREILMLLFKLGIIRILICTDAAGMGCNIPDIDVVVQWKLPASVSSFVQRAGRAARKADRAGLAVLLVEKTVYDADLISAKTDATSASSMSKRRPRAVHEAKTYQKADKKSGYAKEHGIERGGHGGEHDANLVVHEVPLDRLATDEGLYTLAQTGQCRRGVLTEVFTNATPDPTVPCCDLCDPSLLNRTRPAPPSSPKKRSVAVKVGQMNDAVVVRLHEWRKTVWAASSKRSLLGPSLYLDDDRLEKLASVGPITTMARLKQVLGDRWRWFDEHGPSLLEIVMATPPLAPLPPKKRATRAPKRGHEARDGDTASPEDEAAAEAGEDELGRPEKRARTDVHSSSTTSASAQRVAPTLANPAIASVPVTPQRPYHPGPPVYNPYTGMYHMSSSPYPYMHSSSPYPVQYPVQYARLPMMYPTYYASSSSNPPSSSTHPTPQ